MLDANQSGEGRNATGSPSAHIVFIAVFLFLALLARGVRWDETYEHAQILSGNVTYPTGHPLAVYLHNAFSAQALAGAGLLKLGLGPAALCGLRNGAFLLASLLPIYLLVVGLTRSAPAGMAAVLLFFQGIMLEFDGSYPSMVWPELYSNGHIGGGVALLGIFALALGWRRPAACTAGVLPAIHIGQWPPLAATLALRGLAEAWGGRSARSPESMAAPIRTYILWGGLGMLCTLLFWLLHRQFVVPMPATGPFAATGDGGAVWQGYTHLHDPHRRFPPGNGHVILLGALILCALGACFGTNGPFRSASRTLGACCAFIALAVWGTMAVHAWMGPDIPFLLIAWMPYRLINLIPPIVLGLAVAAILSRWPAKGWWFIAAALLAGALQPLWPHLIGADLHARYLAGGEAVAFLLYGAALTALAPPVGRARILVAVLVAAALIPLTLFHQFGAVCTVAGIALAWGADRARYAWLTGKIGTRRLSIATIPLAFAALFWHQYNHRQHLPISPFQDSVRKALEGQENVLLLGPPDSILIQATTGQPVLAEAATPSLISYVPAIGPAIDTLYQEIYGYGFTLPAPDAAPPQPWTRLWEQRTPATWEALAMRYGITHAIAPANLTLQLPILLQDTDYSLYIIGTDPPQRMK